MYIYVFKARGDLLLEQVNFKEICLENNQHSPIHIITFNKALLVAALLFSIKKNQ